MITAEEIIKPENLVYTKPKLMNDTHMQKERQLVGYSTN